MIKPASILGWAWAAGLLLAAFACLRPAPPPLTTAQAAAGVPITITAKPLPLNPQDPAQDRVGRLIFRGCLELSSSDPRFGGFSGLWISPEGGHLLAVSDHGWWLAVGLRHGPGGGLTGLGPARLGRLLGLDGRPLAFGKQASDAEELAPGPHGGLVVAFERNHRLWLYPPTKEVTLPHWMRATLGSGPVGAASQAHLPLLAWLAGGALSRPPRELPLPPWLRAAPANGGPEAVARLADGRLLVLCEGLVQEGWARGALGRPGDWHSLWFWVGGGPSPTSAASLPSGDVLVLGRSYSLAAGVAIRLSRVQGSAIVPNARLSGRALAELRAPLTVDNFEGLAVRRAAGGRTFIYMISDDNYSPLQRTLLMMWELTD